MKLIKKNHGNDFPIVEYGKQSIDELVSLIKTHGGVYIEGFCMIRTIERETNIQHVDGLNAKGKPKMKLSTHVLFAGNRELAKKIKSTK